MYKRQGTLEEIWDEYQVYNKDEMDLEERKPDLAGNEEE